MKADLYTKTVLTIIAIALICIVFQNYDVVPSVNASVSAVPTITQPDKGIVDVRIVGYRVNLPVEIKNSTTVPVWVENKVTLNN